MPSPSLFVTVMRVLLFIAAPTCLALAGLLFWVQFTFSRRKKNTAKTAGILRETDYKQNVTVGIRRRMFFKHYTKARYVYTVNGVEYSLRGEHPGTKRQTPKFVPVVYVTTHPEYAYIDDLVSSGEMEYLLYGILLCFWAISFLVISLAGFGVFPS